MKIIMKNKFIPRQERASKKFVREINPKNIPQERSSPVNFSSGKKK